MIKLANRHEDGWELLDAEIIAKRHPSSFVLPELRERASLKPGDFAKAVFSFDVEGETASEERMWLKVEERVPSHYIGVLDNIPTLIDKNDTIWRGSKVLFEPRHVIEVLRGP